MRGAHRALVKVYYLYRVSLVVAAVTAVIRYQLKVPVNGMRVFVLLGGRIFTHNFHLLAQPLDPVQTFSGPL